MVSESLNPQPARRTVTVRVPAKVNLLLRVGPPGADGYHELVNVFQALSLFDTVTAADTGEDGIALTLEGAETAGVPAGSTNLAVRAAHALAERAGVPARAALHVHKEIPVAGGMAGGSADAAAALLACDALWGTNLGRDELLALAGDLGADVAFPLVGGTAVGVGRGERLTPLPTSGKFHWVIAVAEGGLSTGAVYAACDRLRTDSGRPAGQPEMSEPLAAALRAGDPDALGAALGNDLQDAALSLCPELERTLAAGRQLGAVGALVSGSGPTCAFLAGSAGHAGELAAGLPAIGTCRAVHTVHGPAPAAHVVDA